MSLRGILYAFNGGELSQRMDGRVDLDGIYDRGAAEMVNFVGTVEGPAIKRPGFRYIRAAAASSTWLTRFVFNVTQAYVLEWLDEAVRFYTNGAQIESAPDTPLEVAVPYSSIEAQRVSQAQSYDRLYLAHGSYPPAALSRTGAETFSYAELTVKNGPFKDWNSDEAVTVTIAGTFTVGGSVTVTASSAIFTAGQVGAPFIVEAKDFSDVTAWQPGVDGIVIGDKRRSEGKVYEALTSGSGDHDKTGQIQPTHTSGSEWDGPNAGNTNDEKDSGGILWKYLYDRFGMGTITAVDPGGLEMTMTVTRAIPDSLASVASFKWAHGAFSEAEGWPHLVCLWNGRMIFFKGLEIFGSVVNDYGGGQVNFAPLTDDGLFAADMAFRRRLDAADPPVWVKADKEALIVGTASGEVLIAAINVTEAVSGDNIQALPQSTYGSAEVWPVDIGTAALFVQRGRRKIREAEFSYERERFVGVNITVWARHITRGGIVQMAFQQEPEEVLWAVRGDGVLTAHPHSPEQQVKGFSRVVLGDGEVLSAVAIPSQDGERDELWALAEMDGARHVLQMADWWEEDAELGEEEQLEKLKGAFFVDYGVSYSGEPLAEFTTGLDHLANRQVWVLADGGEVPGLTVTAEGTLTLPAPASVVHVGLGYEARLKPMRPEVRGTTSQQGMRKRIVKLVARLLDAAGLAVRDLTNGNDEWLIDRRGSDAMDTPVPLFSGDTDEKSIGGGYDRTGQFVLISKAPLPAIVLAFLYRMEVEN